VISATSTDGSNAVKVAGTTVEYDHNLRFDHTTGRLTYVGARTRLFSMSGGASLESGNNKVVACYLAKNATVIVDSRTKGTTAGSGAGRVQGLPISFTTELSPNDYIEPFVENQTDITDITVTDMNLNIRAQ